jgi:hypothetical protein
MRNLLSIWVAAFSLLTCSFGAINAVNGVTASTASNINGVTAPSAVNGQSLVAGGGPISFSDNFNRTENPLSDGGAWTNGITGFGNMTASGTVARPASGNGAAFVDTPDFTAYPNQSATITIASTSGVGALVRMDLAGNGYRLYAVSSTSVRISRLTAGVGTALGADITVTALTAGTTITLEVTGTTLNAYRNGVFQDTRSDGTYATGAPGIYGDTNGNTIDAFSCTSL